MKARFYDPHPGFGGAIVRLPQPFKAVADALDGQEMTVEEAMEEIRIAGDGLKYKIEVLDCDDYIGLRIREGEDEYSLHSWRLIRYEKL